MYNCDETEMALNPVVKKVVGQKVLAVHLVIQEVRALF
jgi:hypothetical protein